MRTWLRHLVRQRPFLRHGRDAGAENLPAVAQQPLVVRVHRVAVPKMLVRRHVAAAEEDVQPAEPAHKPADGIAVIGAQKLHIM